MDVLFTSGIGNEILWTIIVNAIIGIGVFVGILVVRASRKKEYLETLPHRLLDLEYKKQITSYQKMVIEDFVKQGHSRGEIELKLNSLLQFNQSESDN
jgi:hypothetical protein